jgi:gluconate kinase
MPPELLTSQLLTLEEPGADENALVLAIDRLPGDIVSSIRDSLGLH